MSWHCDDCGRDMAGDRATGAAILHRLREQLTAEATPLPGSSLSYGRPHGHPRTRYYPRFSKTGERIAGVNIVRPDCPRPIRGRCECPPDGTWRPSVGVVRADATARHATVARPEHMPDGLVATVWVDEVYEQGPDGLWRCRWPVRRALEHLRGSSVRRWAIAIRLLRGDAIATVWGSHGAPPNPVVEAARLLAQVERWADEERVTEWERRPRQWWDRPRPNARSPRKSESQSVAEHDPNVTGALQSSPATATVPDEIGAHRGGTADLRGPTPSESPASDMRPRSLRATASPVASPERACA